MPCRALPNSICNGADKRRLENKDHVRFYLTISRIMENMTKIDPKQIDENVIRLIGSQWMLVTAGNPAHFNTMTASWGGLGFLWNRPVAFVFIRPQRYTFQFAEENSGLTLSFFGEEYRDALKICGSRSGRDTDKVAEAGLTPEPTPGGNVAFGEASLVLECRKLYAEMLRPEAFALPGILEQWYPTGDLHKMYVVEIVNVWRR